MTETTPALRTFADQIANIAHTIRARWTPNQVEARGIPMPTPISKDNADELYRRLAAHFHAWTGQDLRTYRPGSSETGKQP